MEKISTEQSSCPVCAGQSRVVFVKDSYQIRDCDGCNHRFTRPSLQAEQHVSTAYDDSYFFAGGAGYADYLSEEQLLRRRGNWYARLLSRQTAPGRILDVGAAAGFILQGFIDNGWKGNGVEPNQRMAEIARTRLGLEVFTGMLENLAGDLQYDAVSMIQVLPHFIDPKHAMSVVAKVLRPGGLLLIETWNRRSFTARVLGKGWHEYSPPSVLHWFDGKGIENLAKPFGFEKISQGRPPKKISAGHAKSLLRHMLGNSTPARVLSRLMDICPDRVVFPYPAEDLMWMLLRKSDQP